MKVFASWSGPSSRAVAELFSRWLPNVLQDVEVYVSSRDIVPGERWLANVNETLQEAKYGISIVTPDNTIAPWLLYEAGAIAKSLDNRLIPVLCGLDGLKIANHPLSHFQYVKAPDEAEIFKLVEALNKFSERPLQAERLKATFDKWIGDFANSYTTVDLAPAPVEEGKRFESAMREGLEEIMRDTRFILRDVAYLRASSIDITNQKSTLAFYDSYFRHISGQDRARPDVDDYFKLLAAELKKRPDQFPIPGDNNGEDDR